MASLGVVLSGEQKGWRGRETCAEHRHSPGKNHDGGERREKVSRRAYPEYRDSHGLDKVVLPHQEPSGTRNGLSFFFK